MLFAYLGNHHLLVKYYKHQALTPPPIAVVCETDNIDNYGLSLYIHILKEHLPKTLVRRVESKPLPMIFILIHLSRETICVKCSDTIHTYVTYHR